MIDPRLRTALKDSLGKIALVGRVSYADGVPTRVLLSNNKTGVSPATATSFFKHLKPQLRLFADTTVTIGNETFNRFRLMTPAEAGATGVEQPLLADSPLFEEQGTKVDGTNYQLLQQRGGQLFSDLTKALDTIARFSHPNFARCLIALVRTYVGEYANTRELKESKEKINRGLWEKAVSEDQRVSAAAIRVLTGYPGDRDQQLTEFRSVLNDRSDDLQLDDKRVKALSSALNRLKELLESSPLPPSNPKAPYSSDTTLADLAKDFAWMRDLPAQKTWNLPGTKSDILDANGAARKDFLAFYRTFRHASDWVHRFIRTATLHPFLFVWAASKYKAFSLANWTNAADEMFKVGVVREGKGDRVFGESAAERQATRKKIDELYGEQLRGADAAITNDPNFQIVRSLSKDYVYDTTVPPNAFTRTRVSEILVELFAEMHGLTSEVGILADQQKAFTEHFRPVFQAILGAQPAGDTLEIADLRKRLEKWSPPANNSTFLDDLLKLLPSGSTAKRRDVKNAYLEVLRAATDKELIKNFAPQQAAISGKAEAAKKAYLNRLRKDVGGGKAASGLPAVAVTPFVLAEPTEDAATRQTRKESRLRSYREATAHQAGPTKVTVPMSDAAQIRLTPGQDYDVVDAGTKVATLRAELPPQGSPSSGQATLTSEQPITADLQGKNVELHLNGAPLMVDGNAVHIVDLNLRGLPTPPVPVEPVSDDPLESIIEKIVAKYVESSDSSEVAERLRRSLRALTLGEYLLAAPEEAVSLDVADLSQGLGVILELARHVGHPKADAKRQANAPDDETTKALGEINLSRLYPVSSLGEMQTILQYNLDLCTNVSEVREYLTELQELKNFLGSNTSLDLIFVNETLSEHAAAPAIGNLVVAAEKPAVAYLMRQAFKGGATPASSVDALARRIANAVTRADLVVPVLVSPVAMGGPTALPVCDGTFQLPPISPGKPGPNPNNNPTTLVDKTISEYPYLVLAASLGGSGEFGTILPPAGPVKTDAPTWDMPESAEDMWRTRLGLDAGMHALAPQGLPGRSLRKLFHLAWSAFPDPTSRNPLFNLFCLTRLVNLGIMVRRSNLAGPAFVMNFGQLVLAALQDPADRAAAIAGLDPESPFVQALQGNSFQYRNGAVWTAIPANPGVGPLAGFRVQRATGAWVELQPADWLTNFVALLPAGA